MEKIKVNMSPNPLDVQTIHASQNDAEARQWEFELHNNGELIDTSDITEQLFFKAYKGGTEQLLPENTSTPTTSPFIGDIRYPQGLLTDQEFTYRQSPTEEDGLAKITDIKGNTLNWNQLAPINWVQTKTFSDGLSVTNNNDGSYTINGTASQSRFPARNTEIYGIQGHKYYIQLLSSQSKATISQNSSSVFIYSTAIYTAQNNNVFVIYFNPNTYNNEKIIPMIIDLTQMFGSGNEPATVEEFMSLFSLPYYDYNAGTLLSFNGTGIKTTGKNHAYVNSGNNTVIAKVKSGITYVFSMKADGNVGINLKANNNSGEVLISTGSYASSLVFTPSKDCDVFVNGYSNESGKTFIELTGEFQIEFGSVATEYEPYTSSTLSLPISTYFTNGMKSAGSVYDELTETKAITRIGSVDLGSLTWTYETDTTWGTSFRARADYIKFQGQLLCTRYQGYVGALNNMPDMSVSATNSQAYLFLRVKDSNYTDATAFKTAMNGIMLYYELATSTETSFSIASLVTENAEIPLSNDDGVLIGKCTEQLSSESGFFDAKIKLADNDGECYSNKIQLHVERSPQ